MTSRSPVLPRVTGLRCGGGTVWPSCTGDAAVRVGTAGAGSVRTAGLVRTWGSVRTGAGLVRAGTTAGADAADVPLASSASLWLSSASSL